MLDWLNWALPVLLATCLSLASAYFLLPLRQPRPVLADWIYEHELPSLDDLNVSIAPTHQTEDPQEFSLVADARHLDTLRAALRPLDCLRQPPSKAVQVMSDEANRTIRTSVELQQRSFHEINVLDSIVIALREPLHVLLRSIPGAASRLWARTGGGSVGRPDHSLTVGNKVHAVTMEVKSSRLGEHVYECIYQHAQHRHLVRQDTDNWDYPISAYIALAHMVIKQLVYDMRTRNSRWGILTSYTTWLVLVRTAGEVYHVLPPVHAKRPDGPPLGSGQSFEEKLGAILTRPLGLMLAVSVLPIDEYNLEDARGRAAINAPARQARPDSPQKARPYELRPRVGQQAPIPNPSHNVSTLTLQPANLWAEAVLHRLPPSTTFHLLREAPSDTDAQRTTDRDLDVWSAEELSITLTGLAGYGSTWRAYRGHHPSRSGSPRQVVVKLATLPQWGRSDADPYKLEQEKSRRRSILREDAILRAYGAELVGAGITPVYYGLYLAVGDGKEIWASVSADGGNQVDVSSMSRAEKRKIFDLYRRLHNLEIQHGDFAPRNWLKDASGRFWLVDFGHSRTLLDVRDMPEADWARVLYHEFCGLGLELELSHVETEAAVMWAEDKNEREASSQQGYVL